MVQISILTLEVQSNDGIITSSSSDDGLVYLVYEQEYKPGDSIVLKSSEENVYLVIQLEDSINPAFVYMTGKEYRFTIPFGDGRIPYSPKAFFGELHLLTARTATAEEVRGYKNLAKNEYDQHGNSTCYPHASANVETRGEAVFAAQNSINGNLANSSHGRWPFESWGINRRDDAEITVNFGRTVAIDKIVLTTRADFPHDNYWESVTFIFSDGSKHKAQLIKTNKPQTILIDPRKVEWVTMSELIKSDDPSPFPALSQIEIYGYDNI